MASPNPIDYFAIQNVLSLYCFALDTKNLALLSQVMTPDVDAQYPFPGGDMQGLEAVIGVISKRWHFHESVDRMKDETKLIDRIERLHAITSQHALTTQHIAISPSGTTANATTYFSGVHFGKGKWEGQTCTAYGKYIDELVLLPLASEGAGVDPDGEGEKAVPLAGASGEWRVKKRTVEFMARVGEEGIFERD